MNTELQRLYKNRRKALRNLADAEYNLDAARKAHADALTAHAAAQRQADWASNAYDEARHENDGAA